MGRREVGRTWLSSVVVVLERDDARLTSGCSLRHQNETENNVST
jgi:hypothetical protein